MKRLPFILITYLLGLSLGSLQSYAGDQSYTEEAAHICLLKSSAYETAAAMRNAGMPPQNTFNGLLGFAKDGVTTEWLKGAINEVYFDARFVNAGGEALGRQMYDLCLFPNGHSSVSQVVPHVTLEQATTECGLFYEISLQALKIKLASRNKVTSEEVAKNLLQTIKAYNIPKDYLNKQKVEETVNMFSEVALYGTEKTLVEKVASYKEGVDKCAKPDYGNHRSLLGLINWDKAGDYQFDATKNNTGTEIQKNTNTIMTSHAANPP